MVNPMGAIVGVLKQSKLRASTEPKVLMGSTTGSLVAEQLDSGWSAIGMGIGWMHLLRRSEAPLDDERCWRF